VEGLSLDASASGLTAYRQTFQARFTAPDGTQMVLDLTDANDSSQGARYRLARTEVDWQAPASQELYQRDGRQYLVSSELSSQSICTLLGDADEASIVQPGNVILSFGLGDSAGAAEKIDGRLADPYHLGDLTLGVGQAERWSGEVWLDHERGFVLAASGWAEGALSLTGEPQAGRLDWSYALDPTAPPPANLPDDCQGWSLADLPLPPGASQVSQQGTQVEFSCDGNPGDLLAYYRNTLVEHGWTLQGEAGTGDGYSLQATRDARWLEVLIWQTQELSRVRLSLR
jgi:hypothetical protein